MKKIDLKRYMGPWNVIAAIPTFYEKNSFNPVEGYDLNADGTIFNYYDSNRGDFGGPRKRIRAKAKVVDPSTNAKWTVRFFGMFNFAYEILEVGRQYQYSVVGHPSKKYVWIMAREQTMDAELLNGIKNRLWAKGFDISKIKDAPQRPVTPTKAQVA